MKLGHSRAEDERKREAKKKRKRGKEGGGGRKTGERGREIEGRRR